MAIVFMEKERIMFDTERVWESVGPVDLTSNGTSGGIVVLTDTKWFRVGQEVVLSADTLPNITLQVKRVKSRSILILGERGKGIRNRSDLSLYTVLLNAKLQAHEQEKVTIPLVDLQRSVYQEEPVMAYRSMLVDEYGQTYTTDNPIKVQLSDGSINIGTVNADVSVQLSDKESSTGANDYDVVRIGDGINRLGINADRSINVHIIPGGLSNEVERNIFNKSSAIPSGIETVIVSYTVPFFKTSRVQRVEFSGESIGTYKMYKNSVQIAEKNVWFSGPLFGEFAFTGGSSEGELYSSGDVIELKVIHSRLISSFSGRIQLIEIS